MVVYGQPSSSQTAQRPSAFRVQKVESLVARPPGQNGTDAGWSGCPGQFLHRDV
jgi:hypothetical protein